MSSITKELRHNWEVLRPWLSIKNEKDYDRAVKQLNILIDEAEVDEGHPLYEFLDTLGVVIRAYEGQHHAMPECTGTEMLRHFMEEHELTQSDLPEIGSQGIVSEIINGKRELNVRQVRALAKRFGVSPGVFL